MACSVLLAAILLPASEALPEPTSSREAETAVKGWLCRSARPLGCRLGGPVKKVVTFKDDTGGATYYVVYLRPSGFVIVPADDEVEPIVAFAPSGTYDPSPKNPLGALVSRDLPGRVAAARKAGLPAMKRRAPTAAGKWRWLAGGAAPQAEGGLPSVSDERVPPLVQSQWRQSNVNGEACYNYYTPPNEAGNPNNYLSGCVATALAQIMRFHQHPRTGVGTPSFWIRVDGEPQERSLGGGDGAGGPYDWANMALVPIAGVNLTQRQAIGALCHDAGVAIGSSYGPSITSGFFTNTRTALTSTFGYNNARYGSLGSQSAATWNVMINPNLDSGRPVILGVASPGHAVVCDGYGYASSTLYHHLNMGWGGNYDVWYNLPDVESPKYAFDSISMCIYNVFVTGSGEIISGRVVDESRAPIAGATVTANGTYTTTTNAKGIFALAKVPSATTYTVRVTKEGHTFSAQTVTTGTSTDYTATCGNVWYVLFGPLEIVSQSPLPDAITGEPYSMSLWAAGGEQPYTWSITAGALPTGLSLNPSTGEISGTAYSGEVAAFTATVTDSGSDMASRQFQLRARTNVTVTSMTARDIQVGENYAIIAKVRNDTSASATVHVDCVVDDGAAGTQALATKTVTIKAGRTARLTFSDPSSLGPATCTATVTVQEDPDVGSGNTATFAINGDAPPATGSIAGTVTDSSDGTAVAGATVSTDTGQSATAAADGTYTINGVPVGDRTVTASAEGYVQQQKPATVAEDATTPLDFALAPAPLEITTESLPAAVVDQPYTVTLEAGGGTPPYTWAITDGALPTGLTLDANTSVVSGTPTTEETQTFTVGVQDNSGPPQVDSAELTITVGTAPAVDVTIVSVVARNIRAGGKYNITAKVRNDSPAQVTIHVDCLVGVEGEGQLLPAREVTIAAGETANVKFNDASQVVDPGTYTATVAVEEDADVGENDSDTFRVK